MELDQDCNEFIAKTIINCINNLDTEVRKRRWIWVTPNDQLTIIATIQKEVV